MFIFRPMRQADLPICSVIEQTAPDPWTPAQLAEELAFENARLFVAEQNGAPIALAAFQLAAGEASLNTLTVAPAARRQGAGAFLLRSALAELKRQGAFACYLEVRSQNLPALALYDSLGFARAGLRRRFFTSPPDDAVVMSVRL